MSSCPRDDVEVTIDRPSLVTSLYPGEKSCVPVVMGWTAPVTTPLTASKGACARLRVPSSAAYAPVRPSLDRVKWDTYDTGVVNGCGSPAVRPLASSIARRHRFMLPERLLRKY